MTSTKIKTNRSRSFYKENPPNCSSDLQLIKVKDKPPNLRIPIHSSVKTPLIDYKKLSWLCPVNTNKANDRNDAYSEIDHETFMLEYKKVFMPESPVKRCLQYYNDKEKEQNSSSSSLNTLAVNTTTSPKSLQNVNASEQPSFDVRDYLPLLHRVKKTEDKKVLQRESIQTLRQILTKHPFERTATENDLIFSNLQNFDFFKNNIEPDVLKELSVLAQLETWPDDDFVVYGKTGIHMVLKGSVVPKYTPYLVAGVDGVYPSKFTCCDEDDLPLLSAGECFGTWLPYEDPFSEELSVITLEPNCEFLKFTVSDYRRIKEHIKHREESEKLDLLLHCEQYKLWPKQPLSSLAETVEWVVYPPNTVLASEGYKSPFIGFIQSGECHVLRQVEVFHTLKNGKKEQRTKQVVVGKLSQHSSFAEISLLLDEPLTCSIITTTKVRLGIIQPEKLISLDDVTKQLLRQSNTRTFGHLSQEEIQTEYLQQELKRQWNEFKHSQVLEVINARGIRPGYGKWSKK
uniref:Cyclic nucleotide-binding domain-containing protein n=1 Tax=Biomphalaria glabrata TaxID=6526 RepID=A0A2C9MAN1_BIOGL